MKSILFVRHAKSSWESPTQKDFDRPLNERGNKDAPVMASRLMEKKIQIDAFVSSTAIRAITTANYFHQAYKAKKDQLILMPSLYHASVPDFYNVIKQLNNKCETVALFSHNPGITEMVNSLGVAHVDSMPTCAVFGVHADIKNWEDFETADKQFWLFDYPKLA